MKKKFQIFISSTYTDLLEERQAAVEAILATKNIPAGMELFKAGNESQLNTIKKWIDESDIYMLILGGRYGSVESKSGKSYTQIEYEYAVEKGIPVFSVVLSDNFLHLNAVNKKGVSVEEQEHVAEYKNFKRMIMSRIVKIVDDVKDIKISIHESINEIIEDNNLIGWIKGDTIQADGKTNEVLNELKLENYKLKAEISNMKSYENKNSETGGNNGKGKLNKVIGIKISGYDSFMGNHYVDVLKLSYLDIFKLFAPGIIVGDSVQKAREYFSDVLKEKFKPDLYSLSIEKSQFDTIKVMFSSLKLISIYKEDLSENIKLTNEGEQLLFEINMDK